jgi:PTH1 family peptidyl-tRNA hydrolase
MERSPVFRLLAGLGNPGRDYEATRHNAGFLVLDELARRAGAPFAAEEKWHAALARVGPAILMKPMTFMNLSGEAVGGFCRFYKIDPSEVLVIIDDAALPIGRLRLRRRGSAGGHNGLESVINHLGTDAVARLRVGIGSGEIAMRDHVLGRFSESERALMAQAIGRAADAVECAQSNGFDTAMNQFNQRTPDQEQP